MESLQKSNSKFLQSEVVSASIQHSFENLKLVQIGE